MSGQPGGPVGGLAESQTVFRAVLIAVSVVAVAIAAWQLRHVLLLVFASVLVAVILRTIARLIEQHSPLGPRSGLLLSTLFVAGLIAAFLYLMGAQIRSELASLLDTLPAAIDSLGQRFGIENLNQDLLGSAEQYLTRSGFVSQFVAYTSATFTALGAVLLVCVAGVFLAARSGFYREGLLILLPRRARDEGAALLRNVGRALERWILGQLVSMVIIGSVTTLGLYLIGVPSALALGLLAGLAAFVPLLGPIVSFIPALVVAASEGATMAVAVIVLYVTVQQVESNLILPLVQRRVVDLPPVLMLFSVLGLSVLFGPLGLLLGTPLTVVLLVVVKQLYVRDVLEEPTRVPGESDA